MYSVSSTFHNLANADKRKTYLKIVSGATTYTNADLISFNFDEATTDNNITMGEAHSNYVTFSGYDLAILNGGTITVSVSFDNSEWCPLGTFKVSEVKYENDVFNITAYDAIAFMSDDYPASDTTTTIEAVVNAILTRYSLTLKSNTIWTNYKATSLDKTYKGTYRETLGYMAGLMGANAIINRDGKVEFRWYASNGKTLTDDYIYLNGKLAEESKIVTMLISGTSEAEVEYGSGYAINFVNPYMTQTQINAIGLARLPFSFVPMQLSVWGNPAYEIGDILTVDSSNVPIMNQKLTISKGLECELISYGLSSETSLINKNVGQGEVERKLNNLAEIVQEMNEDIIAGRNGYVVDVIEEVGGQKIRRAIRAQDTPTTTPTTKGVEFNSNGIAYSIDGFVSFVKTILDMANGKIYADQIVADSVLSNTFYIGLSDSNYSIKFDGATGNIVMKGNIYRSGATAGTDDFLIGINGTPNLQIGSALNSDQSVYSDVNLYSNDEIRFMVAGAKTGAQAKVIILNNGTLQLKTVPSGTTSTNKILVADANGNVCDSGKTIADIGSGGGGGYVVQSSAPSDTTKLWIDISTGYYIPKVYYSGSWRALNATFG